MFDAGGKLVVVCKIFRDFKYMVAVDPRNRTTEITFNQSTKRDSDDAAPGRRVENARSGDWEANLMS
jgi:hypothetical protein